MAGLMCIAQNSTAQALGAATVETIVQIIAASNHRVRIKRWGVFFTGTSGTEAPVKVRLLRQTSAGTSSALTPTIQSPAGADETIQTTALQGFSGVEPTASDVLDIAEVHPQSGYEVIIPFDMPVDIPGGGRVGIECTAPSAVNVVAKIVFEE